MRFLLFVIMIFNYMLSFELQKPSIYNEDVHEVEDWYMSEKLDGVRAYWNTKELVTKNGNKIFAPDWFIEDFPDFELDGELFTKRGDFENIQSIVLSQNQQKNWEDITFYVFEVPNIDGNFDKRLQHLKSWLKKNPNSYIKIIPQIICQNKEHLNSFLEDVLSKNGEGVIVKNPNTKYEEGRTKNSLKVKKFFDDEGEVIAHNFHTNGTFKSLKIELKDGTTFNLGNGFTKEDIKNPPKIGSIVTFKYYDLTKNNKPKFASFLRVRQKE